MTTTLTEITHAGSMPDGQVVTVLVGVVLALVDLHDAGRCHGSIHPVHVTVDSHGRPRLRGAHAATGATAGWLPDDDLMAVLRLGAALAAPDGRVAGELRQRAVSGEVTAAALLPWLLGLATPQPLRQPPRR